MELAVLDGDGVCARAADIGVAYARAFGEAQVVLADLARIAERLGGER